MSSTNTNIYIIIYRGGGGHLFNKLQYLKSASMSIWPQSNLWVLGTWMGRGLVQPLPVVASEGIASIMQNVLFQVSKCIQIF